MLLSLVQPGIRKFLTITASDNVTRATDNVFVVLEMKKVLEDEEYLAKDYKYQMTETAKDLLRVTKAQKALSGPAKLL